MTGWLVTRSAQYYPYSGTGDWEFFSSEESVASQRYYELVVQYAGSDDQTIYLIRLDASTGSWTQVLCSNW